MKTVTIRRGAKEILKFPDFYGVDSCCPHEYRKMVIAKMLGLGLSFSFYLRTFEEFEKEYIKNPELIYIEVK